mmetsp:Transcript_62129/g.173546  ORF Transcript_62129/g.173546 Transcript_62129/m.173546 type:complete len:746 (-) Transcript_62129:40-2277(-)
MLRPSGEALPLLPLPLHVGVGVHRPRLPRQNPPRGGGHLFLGEAELLVEPLHRRGGSVCDHADVLAVQADPLHPRLLRGRLDGDTGAHGVGEDAPDVLHGLRCEELHAGHADGADLHALLRQVLVCLQHQRDLAPCRHQDHLGLRVAVRQDVGAPPQARGRAEFGPVQRGHPLPRKAQRAGQVVVLGDEPPHLQHLVGVARAEGEEAGGGAEGGELLDGLVRRPILAHADGVVRVDPNGGHLHDRGHADRRLHVVAEDHEGGAVWPQLRQRQAVADGAHGILADAEVQVPAAVVAPARGWRHEVVFAGEEREAGGGAVSGAAQQPGDALGDHVQHLLRRLPRGQALRVRWELLACRVPSVRQSPLHDVLQLARLFRILLAIALQHLQPSLPPGAVAAVELTAEVVEHLLWYQELLVGPAVDLLRRRDLRLAKRRAVGVEVVLLRRRPPGDVGIDDDERWALLLALEDADGPVQGLDVVRVAHAQHVPAVGEEPCGDVLGGGPGGVALDGDLVVVPDPAEVVELVVAGQRRGLRGEALLHAAIAAHRVDVVAEELEAGLVERLRVPLRRHRHAHAVGHALPQRPRRRLDASGVTVLRVPRARGAVLPELPYGLQGHGEAVVAGVAAAATAGLPIGPDVAHAREVDEAVEEHRGVAHGEDEPVAVHPIRILGVVLQHARPQCVCDGGHGHGRAGVAGVRLLHGVHRQASEAIDDLLIRLLSALVQKLLVLMAVEQQVKVDILVRHGC